MPGAILSILSIPCDLPSFLVVILLNSINLKHIEEEVQHWVEGVLKEPFPEGMTFAEALKDGTRLCRLINEVQVRTMLLHVCVESARF